jgi:hypothetical protein
VPTSPGFFEGFGERVLVLLVGPLNKIPELYARGRVRFCVTRGAGYATVMLAGLVVVNLIAGAPIFRAGADVKQLLIRFASYWMAQFFIGALLSLFIWRMVKRIAEYTARAANRPPVTIREFET